MRAMTSIQKSRHNTNSFGANSCELVQGVSETPSRHGITLTRRSPLKARIRTVLKASLLLSSLLQLNACGIFSHMDVNMVAQSSQKPNQVAYYLAVRDGDKAITDLRETAFEITENGAVLNNRDIKLTLLDRESVAKHHVLILVDMSGTVDDPGWRGLMSSAVTKVADRLRYNQSVSVYAFDGGKDIYPIAEFSREHSKERVAMPPIAELSNYKQHDTSRNLNGAILQALDKLDGILIKDKRPLHVGNILLITRGPDLAGRVSDEQAQDALRNRDHHRVAVSMGTEDAQDVAREYGSEGAVHTKTVEELETALFDSAALLDDIYRQYYLVAYCSPARAGTRHVHLQVETFDQDGDSRKGSFNSEFNADDFGSECDLTTLPKFIRQITTDSEPAQSNPAPKAAQPKQGSSSQNSSATSSSTANTSSTDTAPAAPPARSGY